MTESHATNRDDRSPWPHWLAVALVCAIFPLIWVGGLVTTQKAGMAVPDWPSTYGYNLFLYPWQTWIFGPWNLFIEHGHRLLASAVGLLTIGLVVVTVFEERRVWVRWLATGVLAAVVFQGVLGGLRVVQDKVALAKLHGCVGPAFFALAVAMAAVTSGWWQESARSSSPDKLPRLALTTTVLAYVQLVLGSHLRHLSVGIEPSQFRIAVVFHLLIAFALLVHVLMVGVTIIQAHRRQRLLARPALALIVLLGLQLALGAGAWVTKYGWPAWLDDYQWSRGYTIVASGSPQVLTATAHVAVGSLILAVSLLLTLRAFRLLRPGMRLVLGGSARMEAGR